MIISLMGFMGCGKSTIGKKLADRLGFAFLDLDREIELFENDSIENIFKNKGENHFRKIESFLLKQKLTSKENVIISLGGGTPCFNNNITIINSLSLSVFIDIDIDKIIDRLKNNSEGRPLLKNKSQSETKRYITKELEDRKSYYNLANISIKNDNIEELILKIKNYHQI